MPQPGSATVRSRVRIPLTFPDGYRAEAEVFTFHGLADGAEHLALALGTVPDGGTPLVRLHSECLTGDVFGSDRCDCGPQLRESVELISEAGGYLLYLRQEGRGIGLYNKLDAYALQDSGLDTYDANTALGLPEDGRDYTAAAQMLAALGIDGMDSTGGMGGTDGTGGIDLLSNNPDKAAQLGRLGVAVRRRVPTGVHLSASNVRYLTAKVERTGHSIELSRLVG
ncbi:GTP cyclohydrolase II [Kitasatospora aureofaciens]|uniref:GTP cyclohydrolase II n=1 Tax=Kitasatospora aureofaciens TaxID=1894 RepID=UPI0036F4AD18